MNALSKIARWAGIVAGLVLLGALLGWLGSRGTGRPVPSGDGSQPLEYQPVDTGPGLVQHRPKLPQLDVTNEVPPSMLETSSEVLTNWEDKLEEILSSGASEAEKAKKM